MLRVAATTTAGAYVLTFLFGLLVFDPRGSPLSQTDGTQTMPKLTWN